MNNHKTRIAFIKFAGMTIGGSELWFHKIAVNLPKDIFAIDFYYCDDAPYIGGEHVLSPTSEERITYLKDNGVNVIKFHVGAKDIRTLTHDWVDTDFWEVFDESKYDIIQAIKAGPKEYPFHKIKKPLVEIVALANRPDTGKNIAWSFHSSPWQRAQWVRLGGSIERSSVLTAPVEIPQSTENYREELGIGEQAIVAGFHQRNDNLIASPIPLQAFAALQKRFPEESKNWHFIVKNGGSFYHDQAKALGIHNIHFLPRTPDSASVSKFLNTLDVFAHGRKDGETFGAIFVEAMLHGKPCLSHYAVGGANAQPETMGPAGVFARDTQEYEDALHRFFSDRVFRENLARKARPHADMYYSMERCMSELTEVYGKVSHHSVKHEGGKLTPTIPYGYSDLGFLYAGNVDDPKEIAHHILIGGIPEDFNVAIIRSLLLTSKTFLDIGNTTLLYAWIAADYYTKNHVEGASVTILEPEEKYREAIKATRTLNKWEDMIKIGGEVSSSDIISVARNAVVLRKVIEETIAHQPIYFLTPTGKDISVLKTLFEAGYAIYISKNYYCLEEITSVSEHEEGATFLCLHKEKHTKEKKAAMNAVRTYRKDNLIFGLLKKDSLRKAIYKVIPLYVTKAKLLAYSKRVLRLN